MIPNKVFYAVMGLCVVAVFALGAWFGAANFAPKQLRSKNERLTAELDSVQKLADSRERQLGHAMAMHRASEQASATYQLDLETERDGRAHDKKVYEARIDSFARLRPRDAGRTIAGRYAGAGTR